MVRHVASARVTSACLGLILALALVAAVGGCGGSSLARRGVLPGDATMPPLLAELDLASVRVGPRVLAVGVADMPGARSRGLAGTDDLGPLDGLLFVYAAPVQQSFYMRGVRMPLDIAFVGADRRVLGLLTMPICAADPCPTFSPPGPFLWALETPAGGLGGVIVGDVFEIATGEAAE